MTWTLQRVRTHRRFDSIDRTPTHPLSIVLFDFVVPEIIDANIARARSITVRCSLIRRERNLIALNTSLFKLQRLCSCFCCGQTDFNP